MSKEAYTDTSLITALTGTKPQRHRALLWLCGNEKWRASAAKVILNNGGRADQVEEIFQEGLATFTGNVMRGKFKGDSKPLTYFVAICRIKCLEKNRDNRMTELKEHMTTDGVPGSDEIISDRENHTERKAVMDILLHRTGEDCKKVLTMYSLSYSMDEIATQMGYSNTQSAKNKAKGCREKLRKMIVENKALYKKVQSWI